jgi:hypothetical protein
MGYSLMHLKIFHESLQKCHKMFGLPDVSWNSFLEEVIRQNFADNFSRAKGYLCSYEPGLVMKASSSEASAVDSCSPSTSFAYSFCSLAASVILILKNEYCYHNKIIK